MIRRLISILIFALLAATPVASAQSNFGSVQMASIEVQGNGATSGTLAALLIDQATPGIPLASPHFSLDAQSALVKTNHAAVKNQDLDAGLEERILHQGSANIQGLEARDGLHFWITPLDQEQPPKIRVDHPACTLFEVPRTASTTRTPTVDQRRPIIEVPTASTASAQSCTESKMTITGDVSLVLWELDFQLNGDRVNSGVNDATRNAGLPASGVGSADEITIEARNATLTIPLTPETYELYVSHPRIHARDLRLTQATGTLPGILEPVQNEDVTLAGDFAAEIQSLGTNKPLAASIMGTPTEAQANGELLSIQTPAVPGSNAPGIIAASIIAALVLGFVLVRYGRPLVVAQYHLDSHIKNGAGLRARLSRGVSIMADAHLERRKYKRSERLSRRASRLDAANPWAFFILGTSLMHQDRFSEALEQNRASQAVATNNRTKSFTVMGEAEILAVSGNSKGASDALIRARILDPKAAAKAAKSSFWDHFPFQGLITLMRSGNSIGGDLDYHQ